LAQLVKCRMGQQDVISSVVVASRGSPSESSGSGS
jgi:hypothetical protein